MTFNPFKPDSRSHEIVARQNRGDSKDKIVKDLKLKDKGVIYRVNTELRKRRKLAGISALEKKKSSPDPDTKNQDVGSETVQGSEIIQRLPIPPRTNEPLGAVVQIEGFAPGKQVFLTANNILFFQWFKSKHNYEGDISDFLNDAIEDFFRARNWRIKIVKEEVFVWVNQLNLNVEEKVMKF